MNVNARHCVLDRLSPDAVMNITANARWVVAHAARREEHRPAAVLACFEGAGSHEPAACHRDGGTGADHDVVEHSHPDKLQRCRDVAGDRPVCRARLGVSAGVVVGEDRRARVDLKRRPDDFPGVDACAVDRAGEELFATEDLVAVVEPQDVKLLVCEGAQAHPKEVGGVSGVADAAFALQFGSKDAFGGCQDVRFGGAAGELVVALTISDEAHVVFSLDAECAVGTGRRSGKRPVAPGASACAPRKAGTTWTSEHLHGTTAQPPWPSKAHDHDEGEGRNSPRLATPGRTGGNVQHCRQCLKE